MELKSLSSEELNNIDKLTDDLIIWMFNRPNNRDTIHRIIKRAYLKGRDAKKGEIRI